MPIGTGFATLTIANSPVPFNYVGTGATLPLAIGFVPSAVTFFGGTAGNWSWVRGQGFGEAYSMVSGTQIIATAGVLDILNGSGDASANVATTSQVIGLLIGTNSTVNTSAAVYRGLCYR
jgi:hypothetical protein